MKVLLNELRIAVIATLALGVLLGIVYPLLVWAVAQVAFPGRANGSLLEFHGKVVGSRLIGQNFSAPQYFHPRPSAAGKGYDGTSSGGSNLGPLAKKFVDGVEKSVQDYRRTNELGLDVKIPPDAVTASASGLDPHISVANATLQIARVAKARRINPEQVRALVAKHTQDPELGIFGEARVNVLELNLALDGKE